MIDGHAALQERPGDAVVGTERNVTGTRKVYTMLWSEVTEGFAGLSRCFVPKIYDPTQDSLIVYIMRRGGEQLNRANCSALRQG